MSKRFLIPLLFLNASVALGVTPATLVGPDLQARGVNIESLSDGVLSYFDTDRQYKTQPLDQFVQIRDLAPPPPPEASEPPEPPEATEFPATPAYSLPATPSEPYIDLVDGQRLNGQWGGALPDGQKLQWRNNVLGCVTVGLDSLKGVFLRPGGGGKATSGAVDSESDRIELVNGDVITGFVTALNSSTGGDAIGALPGQHGGDASGGGGIQIKPADQTQSVDLALARISSLSMGNALTLPQRGQAMVYLADGSRILGTDLGISENQLHFQSLLGNASVTVPLKKVLRIDLSSAAGVLRPLAALAMAHVEGGVVFGVAMPPRVEGNRIHFHAPVIVDYNLPSGAQRFRAQAQIDPGDSPAEARRWGVMDLVVRLNDQEAGRFHVDAEHPKVEINLPIPPSGGSAQEPASKKDGSLNGGKLSLEVTSGPNGPVRARLLIDDAVLLIR